jgi:hypothetical protein
MGLRAFCDIAGVVRHFAGELDWSRLLDHANRWGADRCAYMGLRLAQELLGAAVPVKVLRSLEPADLDKRLLAWAQWRTLARDQVTGSRSWGWGRLLSAERFSEKVSALLAAIFPRPEILAAKYALLPGRSRVYLYYVVHMLDLARRYLETAWRLFLHDDRTIAWAESEAMQAQMRAWLVRDDRGI